MITTVFVNKAVVMQVIVPTSKNSKVDLQPNELTTARSLGSKLGMIVDAKYPMITVRMGAAWHRMTVAWNTA